MSIHIRKQGNEYNVISEIQAVDGHTSSGFLGWIRQNEEGEWVANIDINGTIHKKTFTSVHTAKAWVRKVYQGEIVLNEPKKMEEIIQETLKMFRNEELRKEQAYIDKRAKCTCCPVHPRYDIPLGR